ncbi:MAG: methyltransferase domain-containing protein [Solirubrobacteraceae bacterium]|nr:methyltransferase domain-containing protein [Solirubrobacteraceae bacterium]
MDHDAYRKQSIERWERAAAGWSAQRARWARDTAPVSFRMVELADPQPGHTIVELACGAADVGLLAAELVRPGGKAILTDGSEAMLELARTRAEELDLPDVELKPMDAEWIDLPAADADAILCRWGLMLLADPSASLRECRRVLRPGGRLVLAAWAPEAENPWTAIAQEEAARMLGLDAPPTSKPREPGMFAWRDPQTIIEALHDVGFVDPHVEQVDMTLRFDDLDDWWDTLLDMSPSLYEGVAKLTPEQRDDLRDAVDARAEAASTGGDRIELPARTHVAFAEA